MGVIWPMVRGMAVPLHDAQSLEEMLNESMPEGYCHVMVIGMDANKLVGMAHRCADLDTQIYMIKEIYDYLQALNRAEGD